MPFTEAETAACRRLIELALAEDLGDAGDLTSQAVIPEGMIGRAAFVARTTGILAGLPAAELVAQTIDPRLVFTPLLEDGGSVQRGDRLATLAGAMRSILATERTALNFLQHLSGIATLTRRYVDAVAGCHVRILDTRKTLPGWRLLAKYAVRSGGGHNHRLGLYEGVLIKDNHLKGLGISDFTMQIATAVIAARRRLKPRQSIEVEVETLEQLDAALGCEPDIILLDNMTPELLRSAVERRNARGLAVNLEASGGVNLETVRAIAESGVDRISIGALTHSAPALDIALDYEGWFSPTPPLLATPISP